MRRTTPVGILTCRLITRLPLLIWTRPPSPLNGSSHCWCLVVICCWCCYCWHCLFQVNADPKHPSQFLDGDSAGYRFPARQTDRDPTPVPVVDLPHCWLPDGRLYYSQALPIACDPRAEPRYLTHSPLRLPYQIVDWTLFPVTSSYSPLLIDCTPAFGRYSHYPPYYRHWPPTTLLTLPRRQLLPDPLAFHYYCSQGCDWFWAWWAWLVIDPQCIPLPVLLLIVWLCHCYCIYLLLPVFYDWLRLVDGWRYDLPPCWCGGPFWRWLSDQWPPPPRYYPIGGLLLMTDLTGCWFDYYL